MTPVLVAERVEDALIPLSALQHYLFCPRQCALIHVEGLWAENVATAEGRLLHEKVDAGGFETRPGVRVARGLQLRSLELGVAGRADAVELRGRPPQPYPVEYKRGRPKPHRADEVQLCAQATALEEMFGHPVARGRALLRRAAAAHPSRLRRRAARPDRRRRRRGARHDRRRAHARAGAHPRLPKLLPGGRLPARPAPGAAGR